MSVRGFDHWAITVADPEATAEFYRVVLGAELVWFDEFRSGRLPVFALRLGEHRLNVHPADAPVAPHARVPTPGSADVCFRWDAPLADAIGHLRACGVAIEEGPVPRPAADGERATSIYFRDPDGNLVELLSTVP